MKLVYLSSLFLFICSCQSESSNGGNKATVEGIYVTQTKGEFSVADDTLVVRAAGNGKDLYSIVRTTGYRSVKSKLPGQQKQKKEHLFASWDEKTGALKEQKHGRVYLLSNSGDGLQIGGLTYQKMGN